MNKPMSKNRNLGFTLIELVLVIAILSIISVGFIGFINIGSNVYQNVSNRDALISDARFSVERLNRELRNALPNSIRIIDDGSTQCLEFVPIMASSIYLNIPVFPDTARDTLDIIKASVDYQTNTSDRVVVYPIDANDAYDPATSNKSVDLQSVDKSAGNRWVITVESDISFAADSPNERLFIVSEPVSYCATGNSLHRHDNYGFNVNQAILVGGVLMAENINVSDGFPFTFDPKLQSDAIVQVDLRFTRNNETVFFSNGVHITNVP
ncbi:type II secretion system protein [Thalassotalea psychrophila]|uniref:Type II secretion system protein n=1 Tax=Thalassotalea psychrophila TaxID=3065647 RepID=A0ABY9TVN3_9GAMM|nr:type II secretion system protein [Colwelliaceae bacterium SQ149]